MPFSVFLLTSADLTDFEQYQSRLLHKVFRNIDKNNMLNIQIDPPFRDSSFTWGASHPVHRFQQPKHDRIAELGYVNGVLRSFHMVWWRYVKSSKFRIEYLPSSVELLTVRGCEQSGNLCTRELPRECRMIDVSYSLYRGRIDLRNLPEKLEIFDGSCNFFKGAIFLDFLPASLKRLNLNANRDLTDVHYGELPLAIEKIDLMNIKAVQLQPISGRYRENTSVFLIS
uniref:Uncharacterized protein n=1 Tax=Paramoeba aestuarina TaxID=180227 RepID=A0A7S4V159_9EUKA|mmetsp:Transcript_9956/g.15064  ORF Transcript_9956/g.15064 Transcript_9956/m.15064 type:complete len:227 (+) Transcript_9956:124-804(+)